MRVLLLIWVLLMSVAGGNAQDSLMPAQDAEVPSPKVRSDIESPPVKKFSDTLRLRLDIFPEMPSPCRAFGDAIGGYIVAHPYFPWLERPSFLISREHRSSGMDWLFYTLLLSLAFLGLLRVGFGRYISDLSVAFFDLAIRQTQIREQLSRQALPSQLMNLQFLFQAALFVHLLTPDLRLPGIPGHGPMIGAWMLLAAALYAGKHLLIRLLGWLSGKQMEAEGYLFIVMMVNKVAGVSLIPMNIILAYLGGDYMGAIQILTAGLFILLIVLRVSRCFEFVGRELRIGVVPYLLFMASFEAMPTLVAGKLLLGLIP